MRRDVNGVPSCCSAAQKLRRPTYDVNCQLSESSDYTLPASLDADDDLDNEQDPLETLAIMWEGTLFGPA